LGRISRGVLRVARAILAQGNQFQPVNLCALAAAGALVLAGPSRAADLPVLTSGHTDVGVNFEAGAWDLHVHAEELGLEYAPDAVWLQVGSAALTQVPTNAAFSFLGEAGAPLWVLPAVEQHDLLFLGLGTEEMASGLFSNDTVTLALKSVTGPGDFILYTLDMFGAPVVSMNSHDGIDASDVRTLTAGGHVHVNWVFTAPGQYRIGLQASGVLAATGETNTSEVAEYLFEVQPARLSSGHVDVGMNFEDGAWDLHVHAEDAELEFAPDHVVLEVAGHAVQKVSGDPRFAFLGAAGSPVWVLPAVENHDLLFLGLGTEEMASGLFSNDTITLILKSVTGPGSFIIYHLDPLGAPVVSMNSRDGIDTNDVRELSAGGHTHVNWVFSTPGQYRIGLQASGVLADTGRTTTSDIVEYLFEVEPLRVDAGHVGVSVAYDTNTAAWTLASGNAALGSKFSPDQVRWIAKPASLQRIPDDARFAFLGTADDPIWILPEVQDPNLLWPGFGLQAVPSGVFTGNDVAFRLVGLEGPGHFFLYQSDMLGNPVVSFNTRDGIDTNDVKRLPAGSHVHVSWGFTEPGTYRVSLQAAAALAGGGETSSAVYDYLFDVRYAPILALQRKDAATLTLQWLSREHHEYHVQSTSDLVNGPWGAHPGVDPVEGTGQFITLDVPVAPGSRFFRLEIHEEDHHHP
jgi:surface-anchored protein